MPRKFRIAYLAHAIRSDWNNGNAHFLRGLLRALTRAGHDVVAFEPENDWSISNLRQEACGNDSLQDFGRKYPELRVFPYTPEEAGDGVFWEAQLRDTDAVIVHEWNEPALAHLLVGLRGRLGFSLLFHDTHHRASSSPEQISAFCLREFDGVLAFGDALRRLYRERFGMERVWTLHEAADTTVFYPRPIERKDCDCVWIGNWGEGERAAEIERYLLRPAAHLPQYRFRIFGVRYPDEGLRALGQAGVKYGGYLPNLASPLLYARAKLTFHVPRQQYSQVMDGIPTIRVFEALACGIPLISAPWRDSEGLFREGDFAWAHSCTEMKQSIERMLSDPGPAEEQARRGLETVLARHTCAHRAEQLSSILEEIRH